MGKLADKLARLDAKVEEAADAAREARRDARPERVAPSEAAHVEPMAKFWRKLGVGPSGELPEIHGAEREDFERLSKEFIERVQRHGLIVVPVNPHFPAQGVRLYDPRPRDAAAEATEKLRRARVNRDKFASQNSAALEREREQEERERLREAIDAADPDALREALA